MILFLVASMLDLAGLGLIGPYVALVVDPHALQSPLGRVADWVDLPKEQHHADSSWTNVVRDFSAQGVFVDRHPLGEHPFQYATASACVHILCNPTWPCPTRSTCVATVLNTSTASKYASQLSSGSYPATKYQRRHSWTGDPCPAGRTNGPALTLLMALLGLMVFGYDRIFRKNLKSYGELINLADIQMVQGIHE